MCNGSKFCTSGTKTKDAADSLRHASRFGRPIAQQVTGPDTPFGRYIAGVVQRALGE